MILGMTLGMTLGMDKGSSKEGTGLKPTGLVTPSLGLDIGDNQFSMHLDKELLDQTVVGLGVMASKGLRISGQEASQGQERLVLKDHCLLRRVLVLNVSVRLAALSHIT